jgi:hypothetical protein
VICEEEAAPEPAEEELAEKEELLSVLAEELDAVLPAKDDMGFPEEVSWESASAWEEFLDWVVYIFRCFTDVVSFCLITTASQILFSSFCWKSSEGQDGNGPAMPGAVGMPN